MVLLLFDVTLFCLYLQINGVNLIQIPARDPYAYGRSVLEILFTKEELAKSVVLKSKKSGKPPLSPPRVQKLFGECRDTIECKNYV